MAPLRRPHGQAPSLLHRRAAAVVVSITVQCSSAERFAFGGCEKQKGAWQGWLARFGHDDFVYPEWILEKQRRCSCEGLQCSDEGRPVDLGAAAELTWCAAKAFLLSHMPSFDLHFLPPSVSIAGESMLDDNIAFALMAWNASCLHPKPPLSVALPYFLPYATFQESRANWRPLFFAKYFHLASDEHTSKAVVDALIANNVQLMNWTANMWAASPAKSHHGDYALGPFAPGSTPPVLGPFDFVAYGYGSCTGWAKFLASALKAVGVPAREVGSPCWNTGNFTGPATDNPNVSKCWNAGLPTSPGDSNANDHTWVEYWDNEAAEWRFLDVAVSSSSQDTWFCGSFSDGCQCSSNAGKAGVDHDILAVTWAMPGGDPAVHGGPVFNVTEGLRLSTGEPVSPLVWSPRLRSPLGQPLSRTGLRVVNRTAYYACRRPPPAIPEGARHAPPPERQ